ncbi:hypothetical protein AAV98_12295 [Bacillus sp. CHD6a]|nr:hypothetical protein AAV98_12295 [Bacillus sp. CHD6a]
MVLMILAVDCSKRRRLLRELALGGDPAGVAEEAPAVPLGKRSHLRKSTAVFSEILKLRSFSVASGLPRRLQQCP